jgi:ketosteroid isomerase-like protein
VGFASRSPWWPLFGGSPGVHESGATSTSGGAGLAKAWAAAWANHLTIDAPVVATLAPSGTTGWVIANVSLDKKTYKIKFRVLFVFDKDASGAWSLVHAHFATNAHL